jgi:hypothetical protein
MSRFDRFLSPAANGAADKFPYVPNNETTTCHNVATPKSFCRFQDSSKSVSIRAARPSRDPAA